MAEVMQRLDKMLWQANLFAVIKVNAANEMKYEEINKLSWYSINNLQDLLEWHIVHRVQLVKANSGYVLECEEL
jgi:hypothetical protein